MRTSIEKGDLPVEERDVARDIERLLDDLDLQAEKLESALNLYNHAFGESVRLDSVHLQKMPDERSSSSPNILPSETPSKGEIDRLLKDSDHWCEMAVQGAAISVYTANKIRVALLGKLGRAPVLSSKLDAVKQKEVGRAFVSSFPDIEEIRNAIAHVGEIPLKEKELDKHRLKKKVRNEFVSSDGNDATFIGASYQFNEGACSAFASMNGKVVSFELSRESVARLRSFILGWRKIFEAAESEWTLVSRKVLEDVKSGKMPKPWWN